MQKPPFAVLLAALVLSVLISVLLACQAGKI